MNVIKSYLSAGSNVLLSFIFRFLMRNQQSITTLETSITGLLKNRIIKLNHTHKIIRQRFELHNHIK